MTSSKDIDYKVILLGETNVGKTSMIKSNLFYKFNENYIPTVGVEYNVKDIFSDVQVKIGIWDTAGQEKFRSLIPLYFRCSQGAMLVFDLTNEDSFYKIPSWISLYHECSDSTADFVLIGNKKDLNSKRKVSYDKAIRFAEFNNYDYYETSALTGENIEEAFSDIALKIHSRLNNTNVAEKKIQYNEQRKCCT